MPETFSLFDRHNRTWEFEGAFERKQGITEIRWPVPGGEAVLGVEPPAHVEAVRGESGADLRILPTFAEGNQLALTFARTSKAEAFAMTQLYTEVMAALDGGRLGHFLRLSGDYLERYPERDARAEALQRERARVEGEASSQLKVMEEEWKGFLDQRDILSPEDQQTRLQSFVTRFSEAATLYEGSTFAENPKQWRASAEQIQSELQKERTAENAKLYLDPAERDIERGAFLRARVYLDNLASQGFLEHLPQGQKARYERLREACETRPSSADVDELIRRAEDHLRKGEREEAKAILRGIIARFLSVEGYADQARKAFKLLSTIE
jgi:hypothetical protein